VHGTEWFGREVEAGVMAKLSSGTTRVAVSRHGHTSF